MTFEEYRRYDALGLAELVKSGQISPAELLEIAIRRADTINPALNAIIHPMYEAARTEAGSVRRDAPFAGVPFLVKDLGMEVAGTPM